MLDNPQFYFAAIPALLIFGISKGGFGGGLGIVAVPLMALVIPPAQAAALLLPLLCLMDLIGIGRYRRDWDRHSLKCMLPGAVVGIAIGSLAFGYLSEHVVRLLLGLVAVSFCANYFLRGGNRRAAQPPNAMAGAFWGMLAGITSTIAHAGGPPANMYLLPRKLDKTLFVGTMVVLFAAINACKIPPYIALGLYDPAILWACLALSPVAALGMLLGIRLHGMVNELLFYRICYVLVLLTGLKLITDGLAGL
ncbi:MAG: sulfite exporter TauE/SafE family protein [Geminicoccaceae bacterium]|nr:sulfite exporter TauE/SafE family protein [Geminicoccaceae bacterium]MCB9943505.1 sulfite exporter TauE/SafE family protein [Geminicoccaceae bacterium]